MLGEINVPAAKHTAKKKPSKLAAKKTKKTLKVVQPKPPPGFAGPLVGISSQANLPGVLGENTRGGAGVEGSSPSGIAVYGHSTSQAGVQGESKTYDAVRGVTQSSKHAGVAGHNQAGGPGLWGSGTPAGQFVGDINVSGNAEFQGDVHIAGTLTVDVDVVLTVGADCAEEFDIDVAAEGEPGTVMTLDPRGRLRPCDKAYDRTVVGVISGAGDFKPGIVLDRSAASDNRRPIALVGKVYCKVDASLGAVNVGDLLTTSPTSGHAMRATDIAASFGAIIGKALGPLHAGQGLLPIVVALQ